MNHKRRLLAFAAGLSAVAVASVAGASTSSAAPTGATTLAAPAGKVTIWTDADRKPAVDRIASAWGTARRRRRRRPEGLREDPRRPQDRRRVDGSRRDRRCARPDGRARGQRPRAPALPVAHDAGAVPAVRAQRVLVRHGRQAPLRRPGRDREHRPGRQHEAREGAEELRRPAEAGPRVQAQEVGQPRHRRPAGQRRRRVPHVPVLLGPLRLRVRHEPRRQPRSVRHRPRRAAVPPQRQADRRLEQDRPRQREGRRQRGLDRVPHQAGGVLDPTARGTSTASRRRASASRSSRCRGSAVPRCRSSASRASWSRSSPRTTASRAPRRTSSATT